MSEVKLEEDETDFSDSDFSDDGDLGLDLDLVDHDIPYITSPVFPDMPKLKDGCTPRKVNANGIYVCDVGVGNDFDFAETKETGVQVSCKNSRKNSVELREADDQICFNDYEMTKEMGVHVGCKNSRQNSPELRNTDDHVCFSVHEMDSNGNKACQEGYGSEETNDVIDERFSKTMTMDKDNRLIQQVYVENIDANNSLASRGQQKNSNTFEISDDSENSLSETDLEYDEGSSEDEFWPHHETDRSRWIGVSPAKFRLLRKWFYD